MGRATNYIIIIEGTLDEASGDIPQIQGLSLQSAGPPTKSAGFDDGKRYSIVEHTFVAYPHHSGRFVMPSFDLYINGIPYRVPSTELEVTKERPPEVMIAEQMKFNMTIDTDEPFVGEMVPVDLTLSVPSDIGNVMASPPTLLSNDFISHGFKGKPLSKRIKTEGKLHTITTWNTFITPLKSGSFSFQYQMNMTATVAKNLPPATVNSFFGRTFSQTFRAEEVPFSIKTPITNIKINPLPSAGRPSSFNGAIGNFNIENPHVDPKEVAVGEPITLRFSLSGEGNFDHISIPELNPSKDWKIYKPKMEFIAEDAFNFKGRKEFEYILIPQSETIKETPALSFSTFDPSVSRYRELRGFTLPIKVNPDPSQWTQNTPPTHNITPPVVSAPQPKVESKTGQKSPSEPINLAPNKVSITKTQDTLLPLFYSPYFIITQVIVLCLLTGFYIYKRRQIRLAEDEDYSELIKHKVTMLQLESERENAYKENKLSLYFDKTEALIKEEVAFWAEKDRSTLTGIDVTSFLQSKAVPADLIEKIRDLLNQIDGLKYGGEIKEEAISSEKHKEIKDITKKLKSCLNK